MLWAAAAYASGSITNVYAPRPAGWCICASAVFLAAGFFFLRRRKWLGRALALAAFGLLGAANLGLRIPGEATDCGLRSFAYGPPVQRDP
jgi:hypothetical protein